MATTLTWFEKITLYYSKGAWDKDRVHTVVGKVITAEEYKLITGEDYVA